MLSVIPEDVLQSMIAERETREQYEGRYRYLATVKDRRSGQERTATASSAELAVKKLELALAHPAAMLTGQDPEPSEWGER